MLVLPPSKAGLLPALVNVIFSQFIFFVPFPNGLFGKAVPVSTYSITSNMPSEHLYMFESVQIEPVLEPVPPAAAADAC